MTDSGFYKRKVASTLRRIAKLNDDLEYYTTKLNKMKTKQKVETK